LRIFFSACAELKTGNALTFGKKVFNQLMNGSNQLDDLLNMVLNMFIKCGDLKSAESVFDRMRRDVVSYGSIMKLYNIQSLPETTWDLFQRMNEEKTIPNEINYVLIIDALSAVADLSLCESLLCKMPEHFLMNSYIQNGLINLWVQ
jgi:pentatricopeptide repeat protein